MIIGRGVWGYPGNPFKTVPYLNNFYRLEIQNAIFDEIRIDNTSVDIAYNSTKTDWDYNCIFQAKFQGDLEAGNVDNQGVPIEKVLFQRRAVGDYTWQNVASFDFSTLQTIYEYLDRYVANDQPYEYCLVPLTNTIIGNRTVMQLTPKFDGIFLTSKDFNLNLILNMTLSDIEHNHPNYLYEPLGGNFPIVNYSTLNYKKSSVKAFVLSDNSLDFSELSAHTEKVYRDSILNFLKNNKPKLMRLSNGDMILIAIVNNPKFSPENNLSGRVGSVSFDFVEIGDATNQNTLSNNGF